MGDGPSPSEMAKRKKQQEDELEESRREVREFFGLNNLKRKPIPCYTFNTLVHLYSLLPDQTKNPFAEYANDPEYSIDLEFPKWNIPKLDTIGGQSQGKDDVHDNSGPRRKKERSNVFIHPSGVEDRNSSLHHEGNSDGTSVALCKNGVLSGPELTINEMLKAYDEEGPNAEATGTSKIHGETSLTMETNSAKLTAGEISKVNVVDGSKGLDVEVNTSISEVVVGISQAQHSVKISSNQHFVKQNAACRQDAKSKDRELCVEKIPQELSEVRGQISSRLEGKNAVVDKSGKGDQFAVIAKGKTSKVKNTKKTSRKDVESGKHKHISANGEASCGMKSGGDDPMVDSMTLKQSALPSMSPSVRKDDFFWPKSSERLRYTREQLLDLGKIAIVPEHIKKAAREIKAEIHGKDQISAALNVAETGILKNKRGGSEARKERKKLKKKLKRAEVNRKLGVKRLKLKPVVKPKVVKPCRHYLNGRCHEGENCKFSHDVVPLTKSKPCTHFARHACMKGDDCPFDHQLSKYPCNNYADTGFCGRGDNCLFSHKVPIKEGARPPVAASKVDTSSVDQLDLLKSKQQADATIPFTFGKVTPNNAKETSPMKTTQPAKRPKGLSFLSFGKSQLDDAVQPKESDLSQPSSVTIGTKVHPNMVSGEPSNVTKMLMDVPGSGTQGIDHPLIERSSVDSCGDNSSRYPSSEKLLLNDSAKYQLKGTPGGSNIAVGTLTADRALLNLSEMIKGTPTMSPTPDRGFMLSEMIKGTPAMSSTPERTLKLSEMCMGTPTLTATPEKVLCLSESRIPEKLKGDSVSSSDGPSYDISGSKSASVFSSKGHSDLASFFRGKGTLNAIEKSKDLHPGLPSFQTFSGQTSTNINLPVKMPPSNANRALQSALAFASGIKVSSVAALTKEMNKNEGT